MPNIFTKTAQAAETLTSDAINKPYRGVRLHIDITAEVGTALLDTKIQVLDQISGTWADLPGASTPQLSGTGHTMLTVFPNIVPSANVAVAQYVNAPWRVVCVVGSTGTFTFTVSYDPLS